MSPESHGLSLFSYWTVINDHCRQDILHIGMWFGALFTVSTYSRSGAHPPQQDFKHTREHFIPPLLESAGINTTDPALVVAVFKTVPLERGYIYVRHSLSHTHNFMEIGKDAVLCSEMADELHQGFALTNSNVLQIADCMHDRGSEL